MSGKAGHSRAFLALSSRMTHYRCPLCLDDVRPQIDERGVHCPLCAGTDPRYTVTVDQQSTRSGFHWVAELSPTSDATKQ